VPICLCFGLFVCQLEWQGEYVVRRTVIWYKANLTFAQYIVFTEEMYESAVNHNAEDFPKVAVDSYPTVVIGVKFVSTFVDCLPPPSLSRQHGQLVQEKVCPCRLRLGWSLAAPV
jgi:hypothetical protein